MTPGALPADHPIMERWPYLWPLLLTALALLTYANSFPGAFIQDDLHIVRNNPLIQNLDLRTIFTSDYWHGYANSGLYRPMTILSLGVNRALLGSAPWGFHLVNVLLHTGATLLLWRLLRRWGLSKAAALLAAVLFAVHPIHAEVVNEAVGRSELLAAVFSLISLLLANRSGVVAGGGTILFYLLALLSKEHVLVLPAVLLLSDTYREGSLRKATEGCWRLYLALAAVAIGWLLWRSLGVVQHLPPSALPIEMAPLAHVDITTRLLTALLLQGVYLFKLLWPTGLQAVYVSADLPSPVSTVFSPAGMLVVVATMVVAGALWYGWRRKSLATLFAVLYLVSFLVTANLLFPIGVIMAERLAYLPSLWFCSGLAVLWLAALRLRAFHWRWLAVAACGGYLVFLTGTCVVRNADFASEVRLWQAEVVNNPADYLAWQNLAESLANEGLLDEAERAYRQLLEQEPKFLGGLRSATTFYLLQERFSEALNIARRGLELSTARNDPMEIMIDHFNLARINIELQQFEVALMHLEQGSVPGREAAVSEMLGRGLSGLGRDQEAVAAFQQAGGVFTSPRSFYAHGLSLLRLEKYAEARWPLEKAADWLDNPESWNLLGVNAAMQGDWPAAVAAMSRAVAGAPNNQLYKDNLLRARQSIDSGANATDRLNRELE